MELHTLKPAIGSLKNKKRVGRGQGSGKGGTATRGYNGAQSRSGYKRKIGFEGGQQPLQRRLPMYGFKCPSRIEFTPLNLNVLQALAEKHNVSSIDAHFLRQHRVIGKNGKYKILGGGQLNIKLSVAAHRCSASAMQAIQNLGGTVIILPIYE
ncbi:50S ribosomal protein L15 [Cardinium endosymbiont of Culicoides punctatus]|uniref:50S ribosomal protein L15 n=1 Tax=Cardinium endosymbiont of Culicoides punctatus TaxID=2304601 RepID=UPI0010590BE4|nr:50S ribosomal protein L15 [Cardinium endosymbiont of Culicoides punctatus]TDG95323.1 50S ribosomal protein L15 [Cardinium endosymbiont of Culicoides punctatus]